MDGLRLLKEAQIWTLNGQVILTDPPESTRLNAVFPLCPENVYLSENLDVRKGDVVLDLCTGSGVVALAAAEKARRVVGVDINPRALSFARFNAALNGMEDRVNFCLGDLFSPVREQVFNLICANPPFEPVPSGCRYYVHSDGGPEGTDTVKRICSRVQKYLAAAGVFQMIVCSLDPGSTTWYNSLRSSFQLVEATLVRPLSGAEFKDELADRLIALNPSCDRKALDVPAEMGMWFVTAKNQG